ncbi:tetratricopeptide repeat protein [Bradyrhizobium macuxiense]|uniref:tetratricopeptide repeat protein n=1 Tax=Bradyrhizobium macuxiense TaxID=1755647 RepID=UPI003221943D
MTGAIDGLTPLLVVLLLASPAVAQAPKKDGHLHDIELCNGVNRSPSEARINSCTALIEASQDMTTAGLAIAYNNRGNAYAAGRDYDRAIRDFDSSIKLNPKYDKPLNNRGVAFLKKGEYDRAIDAFDQAIKLTPSYGEAFANRAGAYLKKSEYDRAAQDYDEAIRLEPNLEGVWNGRCWTRAILGALRAALEDCNKALQSNSSSAAAASNAATYDSRGLIYLKMGQTSAAVEDYSSALRLDPKLASAFYGRGLAELKRGDHAHGDADISKAKAIRGNIADDFARYGVR